MALSPSQLARNALGTAVNEKNPDKIKAARSKLAFAKMAALLEECSGDLLRAERRELSKLVNQK